MIIGKGFGICLGLTLLCLSAVPVAHAEETCSGLDEECGEAEGGHNVWMEADVDDDDVEEEMISEEDQSDEDESIPHAFNELENELFRDFFNSLEVDFSSDVDPLAKYRAEAVIFAILNTFIKFDSNDDGFLEFKEMESVLGERESQVELTLIEDGFTHYENWMMSIFDYMDLFKKLEKGADMVALLTPFDKLHHLPPQAAKKVLYGSVQMFIDSDEDGNGELNKDEFGVGMKRSQEKRGIETDFPPEQIDALFAVIDKDQDEALTYLEFQSTIPAPRKTADDAVAEVFKEADTNSDGVLSETEFEDLMKSKLNTKVYDPSEDEISEGFEKLDTNEDGVLSPDELKGILEELKSAHEKRMNEAFTSFDDDGDGFLSEDELEKIVKGIEANSGQKIELGLFLSMLDQDKDGKVSLPEMQLILTKMMANAPPSPP